MENLKGHFKAISVRDAARYRAESDAGVVALGDKPENLPYALYVRGEQAQELRTNLSQRRLRNADLFLGQLPKAMRGKSVVKETVDLVCGDGRTIDRDRMYTVAVDVWNLMVEKAVEIEGGPNKLRRRNFFRQFFCFVPAPGEKNMLTEKGLARHP